LVTKIQAVYPNSYPVANTEAMRTLSEEQRTAIIGERLRIQLAEMLGIPASMLDDAIASDPATAENVADMAVMIERGMRDGS
jgi:hypothetical protein